MRVDKEESRIVCTKKSQVRIVVEMMLEGRAERAAMSETAFDSASLYSRKSQAGRRASHIHELE